MDKEEVLKNIDRFIGNIKTAYTALFQYIRSIDRKTVDEIKVEIAARFKEMNQYISGL